MRKLPARKLLGAIIAGALLLPKTAFTLGLGEIEVNSALNQKLKADIELLSATPEDIENIIVKLASRKDFSRAGLDRPYLLNDLRFKSEVVDGSPRIIVSSGSPIREPFLNFLVEIDWPNGHLIREYTVLLDPPVFMTQPASAASAPANKNASTNNSNFRPGSSASTNVVPVLTPSVTSSPAAQTSGAVAAPQNAAPATNPAFIPAPYVQPQTAINQPTDSYRIKQGDTAWSLADAMRPDRSISVEQMMIAMLRANPESFINENINGLKRGYILRVPDYNQIASINSADARALVREQAALWRQYQQTQAAGKPASAMSSDAVAGGLNAGGDAQASAEDNAYLEIVSAGSGSSTASSKDPTDMNTQELRAELALARERVETERVEKEALQSRVDSLEQNVDKMKGMLSIEDNELSGVQALGETAEIEPTEGEMLEADIVADAEAEMAESSAETNDMLAEQNLDDAVTEEAADTENAVFLDEAESTETPVDMHAETETMQNEVAADTEDSQSPIVTRPAETGVLDKLLSDPILLAAAGGGLLFIIAMMALIIKRRKASAEAEAESFDLDDDFDALDAAVAATEAVSGDDKDESELADASQTGEEATAETGFDSDSTMILDSAEDTIIAEEDSAVSAEEEEPRDDVIAEADVYLAYGIYQQAEELLTQAITDNPERDDYRVKLAETHYASKNSEAFVEVASELRKRTDDDMNPMWKKVMVMGQDLCADNVLFQGSMVGGLDVDALSPKTPEMDFDLGMDDASGDTSGDASPDLDLSLDEEPIELPEIADSSEEASDEAASEIEFDLSDAGAVEEAAAEEDEFSLDIDATELDIDIQDDTATATNADDEVHDVGDVDLDFGLDDEPAADVKSESDSDDEVAFDLTSDAEALGLDLDDSSTTTDDVTPTAAPLPAEDDEDDFDLSSLADVDEVSTKLDLARAYLDMGDHEGTRGILEEVIAEGNDEQKEEANELMSKLD